MRAISEEIEQVNQGIDTFKIMRLPIISELGVKLGITDEELSALVDYVGGEVDAIPD